MQCSPLVHYGFAACLILIQYELGSERNFTVSPRHGVPLT
jgi:hypothetical protein